MSEIKTKRSAQAVEPTPAVEPEGFAAAQAEEQTAVVEPEESAAAQAEEQTAAVEPEGSAAAPKSEPPLSPRRRSALVTYLAILFAVAFLLVAIMFLEETKRLQTVNEKLQDDNQRSEVNAITLVNNIGALQEENAKLQGANQDLLDRIETMENEAVLALTQAEKQQENIDQLMDQIQVMKMEKAAIDAQIAELTQRAEDAVTVSELLQKAISAEKKDKKEELKTLLEEIEPLKELLCETELEMFEELTGD